MPTNSEAADRPARSKVGGLFSRERLTSPSSVLFGTNAISNVLRLASTILLTRLLSPDAFGLIAMIASFFYVITMITDAGFQAFVVRHERDDPDFEDAIWSVHFARGILNAAVAALLATPVAWLLHKPALAPLGAVAAITFAIEGSASLTLLTALRRNMVRRLSLVDLTAQFGQFLVGIVAAYVLRSPWALIISLIAGSLIRTIASYVVFPAARRRIRYDRTLTSELWRFSRVIAASSVLTLVISQVDKLVLGRVLSLQQFGIYSIAINLAAAPAAIASQYVTRIFYPAMAETWRVEPEATRQRYYSFRGIFFYGYLLGGGVLIGSAPLVIRVLYDPRYVHAGFYLQLLGISATFTILTYAALNTLVAVGHVQAFLTSNIIRLIWLLPVGLGGLLIFGPIGLIVTIALIEVPPLLYANFALARRGLFDLRAELFPLAAISVGVLAGFAVDFVARTLFANV